MVFIYMSPTLDFMYAGVQKVAFNFIGLITIFKIQMHDQDLPLHEDPSAASW